MAAIEHSVTKIIVNDNNEVEFIFFQDANMKANFHAFPDLILFDGTYNLNDRKMPLVVIMVVDGSGVSHIAGFIIVQSENVQTFDRLFEIFKQENPNHTKIEVIMSDKSFANRSAFANAFDAEHHFCVFHVLQIFQREITTRKREITAEQRTQIQSILRAMVYAESESKYVHLYEKLKAMNCQKVNEYFDANWHNIRDQWVAFYCNQYRNYEERTNNRLESFNQKIKAVVSKYSGIAMFFEDLWTCTVSYNIERDHQLADDVLRKPLTLPNLSPIEPYVGCLTNYAFQKIRQQFIKSTDVEFSTFSDIEAECIEHGLIIKTTNDECNCGFRTSADLICAHLFAFFTQNDTNLFRLDLCNKRYSIHKNKFIGQLDYIFGNQPSTSSEVIPNIHVVPTQDANPQFTQHQKFLMATEKTKEIAEWQTENNRDLMNIWEH